MSFLNKPLHWLLRKLEKIFDGTDAITGINFGDETLSAYDEGTWTPALYGSTTAGEYAYTTQLGFYVRIGKICWINARINASSETTTPGGQMRVSGLPFTVETSRLCPLAVSNVSRIDFADQIAADAWSGQTYIALLKLTAGTGSSAAFLTNSDLGTTPALRISGVYEVA